jgi:hypothetical protein
MEFRKWIAEYGLADYRFRDQGAPRIKNKVLPNPGKAPDVPDASKWISGAGSNRPSFSERRLGLGDLGAKIPKKPSLPKFDYIGGDSMSNTKLDPG